jgi:hypothetical protein
MERREMLQDLGHVIDPHVIEFFRRDERKTLKRVKISLIMI